MAGGEKIFMWVIVLFIIIVIAGTIIYVIVKTPGQTIRTGGLDVIPVSEPPDPVGLTYDCNDDSDCLEGLVCDKYDYTCRMGPGSPCYHASDCHSGMLCSGVCIYPNQDVDLNMDTYVDSRYACNQNGLPCDKGAQYGQPGNPDGAYCCNICQPGDTGCTGNSCGRFNYNNIYTTNCSSEHRNCPCQNGKSCVPSYGRPGEYECRILPNNPCVCSGDCITRSCIKLSFGSSSKYPVGICSNPAANGAYCTVNEGCASGNCSFILTGDTGNAGYGYCQPKGISNGETGASCDPVLEPRCNGATCYDRVCTAPNAYGLELCGNGNICGDAFFCASASVAPVAGTAGGNISINVCNENSDDNCMCLYGNPNPGTTVNPTNTSPNPLYLNKLTSECIDGMSVAYDSDGNRYCIPSVITTPGGLPSLPPSVINGLCENGKKTYDPAIYRMLPLTRTIFPTDGLQGLQGIYYEKIPIPPGIITGEIKKIIGVSVDWSIEAHSEPDGVYTNINRGTGDMLFIVIKETNRTTIIYRTLTNGPIVQVGEAVMDGGVASNQTLEGWKLLASYDIIVDFDAFWANGQLQMYCLVVDNTSKQYNIHSMYIDSDGFGRFNSTDNIRMPNSPPSPNPGWNTLSCSDYHSAPTTGSKNVTILLTNRTGDNTSTAPYSTYCTNVGPNGSWTNWFATYGKANLGYGSRQIPIKDTIQFESYPVVGRIYDNNKYRYFNQPYLFNANQGYQFSMVQYPQNTYISNISSEATGAFNPIYPPTGSKVNDYSIVNVSMSLNNKDIDGFIHFAYISTWANSGRLYVYYVGTGLSMVLPLSIDTSAKVIVTPANLYLYTQFGCVPST